MPKVVMTARIGAPASEIWPAISTALALAAWHPLIVIKDHGPDCAPRLHLRGLPATFIERPADTCAHERRLCLAGGEADARCEVHVHVRPEPDGGCMVIWVGTFAAEVADELRVARALQRLFHAGSEALERLHAGNGDRAR